MPVVYPLALNSPTERKNIKQKYIHSSCFTAHWLPPRIYLHILQNHKKKEEY